MRLLTLSERRRAETKIMYHGTATTNLRSIMVNGLVQQDKAKRVWGSEQRPQSDFSRASVGGIYLASNYMTALSAAGNARRKFGGEGDLIVICQVQPRSALPDEDDFRLAWTTAFDVVLRDSEWLAGELLGRLYAGSDLKQEIEMAGDKFMEYLRSVQEIDLHPEVEKRVRSLLPRGLVLRAKMLVSRISDHDYRRNFLRGYEGALSGAGGKPEWDWDNVPPQPDWHALEPEMLDFMGSMSQILKQAAWSGRKSFQDTLRVVEPIGFAGRTKIIGIVRVIDRFTANIDHTKIQLLYGRIPDDMLEQHRERVGSQFKVEDQRPSAAKSAE